MFTGWQPADVSQYRTHVRRTCRRVVVLIGTDGFGLIVCWETGFLPADSVKSAVFAHLQLEMFSNSKDSLCHQLGHEEHLLKSCFSFIDLSKPLHPFFLHKPGHDQCFLVWRTGSDWTAKLKQAEVLCCQKNHSEMKCCCHGLCDVWHVLLANPLWLQGLDAVHYMFRHTPSATQQHNYDVLYNSAGMSWSSSGFIWGHKAERFQWDRWNCM